VRERVKELGRELKPVVRTYALNPLLCCSGARRAVIGRIDFNGVEVFGDVGEFIESSWLRLRVYDTLPVLVFPASGPTRITLSLWQAKKIGIENGRGFRVHPGK